MLYFTVFQSNYLNVFGLKGLPVEGQFNEGLCVCEAGLFLCMTITACSSWFLLVFVAASQRPIWKGFLLLFWPSYVFGVFLFYFRHVMLCMDVIDCLASQHVSWVFLPVCFCRTSHWMASDQSAIEGCGQSSAAFRQKFSMQWELLPLQLLDTPTTDVIISPSSFAFLIYSLRGTLMQYRHICTFTVSI